MSVNLEVKGIVAKLLAQENLLVEHRQVRTAQFNVDTRVLTLPIWDKASETIVDLLVAHEVGHALYTPNEDWGETVPRQFINVVEDARVEKLIKRRFPGLAKTFYKGYKELHSLDFFSIEDEDLDSMNLADRINLHSKIGAFLSLKFSMQEEVILSLIDNSETFDDVILAAELLYKYCKREQEKKTSEKDKEVLEKEPLVSDTGASSDGDFWDNDDSSFDDSDISSPFESDSSGNSSVPRMVPDLPDQLTVDTADSLEEKIEQFTAGGRDIKYLERPDITLDDVIISNEEINDSLESFWEYVYQEEELKQSYLGRSDNEFIKYKKSAQKEVSYLVKEFEWRKSAGSYSRSTTNRTGVLDTTKLQTYKFNDDIFRKISIVPEGQNHGLIFVLDWSGSMSSNLGATVKQLFNLVWFCRKVNIPFKVYGFTNCWITDEKHGHYNDHPVKDTFWIESNFRMLEFLTSDCNAQEFERTSRNFWRLVTGVSRDLWEQMDFPPGFQLSGTPLNEALLTLHKILPKFQQKHGVEKLHTIILTDGEGAPLAYANERYREYEKNILVQFWPRHHSRLYIRDRKLRNTYHMNSQNNTPAVLKNLRDNFPSVNFIGIRITSGAGDISKFIRWYEGEQDTIPQVLKTFRTKKSTSITLPSFTKFFVIKSSSLHEDNSFEVEEGAKKSTIKAAFRKSLNNSKFNRKILSEFVELIV